MVGEFIKRQLDETKHHLTRVLQDWPLETQDFKVTPSAMSPRETIPHLAECNIAGIEYLAGIDHEWVTYHPASQDWSVLCEEMFALHDKAVSELIADGSEKAFKALTSFVLLHEEYHVGQLVQTRSVAEPEWDVFAIYKKA